MSSNRLIRSHQEDVQTRLEFEERPMTLLPSASLKHLSLVLGLQPDAVSWVLSEHSELDGPSALEEIDRSALSLLCGRISTDSDVYFSGYRWNATGCWLVFKQSILLFFMKPIRTLRNDNTDLLQAEWRFYDSVKGSWQWSLFSTVGEISASMGNCTVVHAGNSINKKLVSLFLPLILLKLYMLPSRQRDFLRVFPLSLSLSPRLHFNSAEIYEWMLTRRI